MARGLSGLGGRAGRLARGLVSGHDVGTVAYEELRCQRSYRISLDVDNAAEIPIVRISVPGDRGGLEGWPSG